MVNPWLRFWVVAAFVQAVPSVGGQITGHILSDHGGPVAGALVTVQRSVASPSYQMIRLVTDAQGKFSVDVPEAGTYSVCAGVAERGLLNSCEWGIGQNQVELQTANANAQIKVTLATGLRIQIRLDDPGHVLPPQAKAPTDPAVGFDLITVDGRIHATMLASIDDKGRNHVVLVPIGTRFQISPRAQNAHVLDSGGTRADNAPGVAMAAAAIESVQFQRFQVVKSH